MKKNNDSWSDEILAIASIGVPLLLILLSLFAPKDTVSKDQKDILLTAGLALIAPAGFGIARKKTEITQEVQQQEMNLSPSSDSFVQYNPPQQVRSRPYLSEVSPEDAEYLTDRHPVASSPYKIVSPDENDD